MESNDDVNENTTLRDSHGSGDDESPEYKAILDGKGKKKKNVKNNTRTGKMFYVKFLIALLIFEAYYLYNYGIMVEFKGVT